MSKVNHSNGTVEIEPVATEVQEPGRRRIYTPEYKRQIVAEVNAAPYGSVGAILRREGLYSTTVNTWRAELSEKRQGKKPGRKASAETPLKKENQRLTREIQRLEKKLAHAALIIDVQKKIGLLMSPPDDERAASA